MKTNENEFIKEMIKALKHFAYHFFIYFLFVMPFELWKKATLRLAEQNEKGDLNISKLKGAWPFLSFLKVFFLNFFIDGIIFIQYILGGFISIFIWIETGEFKSFMTYLAFIYLSPVLLSLVRDIIQLCMLPFKKFVSWVNKPAQFLNLEIENKSKAA